MRLSSDDSGHGGISNKNKEEQHEDRYEDRNRDSSLSECSQRTIATVYGLLYISQAGQGVIGGSQPFKDIGLLALATESWAGGLNLPQRGDQLDAAHAPRTGARGRHHRPNTISQGGQIEANLWASPREKDPVFEPEILWIP